ncbi:MAG: FxsA family protein, partial [Myxococcota bacterium]
LSLLFIVVPAVELALLAEIGTRIGWLTTVGLIVATGIVGAALARTQGFATLHRIQVETAEGRVPADAMTDGALILFAGALLITPGILTDAVGFSLLIPPLRAAIKRALARRFERSVQNGQTVVFFRGGVPPRPGSYSAQGPRPAAPPDPDRVYEAHFDDE